MEYLKEEIEWFEEMQRFAKEDALVVCQDEKGKNNLITIGWKTIGILWSRPIITIAVHPKRFSHSILEKGVKEFTINFGGTVEPILEFCGTQSGKDVDKVQRTGIKLLPCKTLKVPIISGSALSFGCKIIHSANSGDIIQHTLYFGEIIETYRQIPKKIK